MKHIKFLKFLNILLLLTIVNVALSQKPFSEPLDGQFKNGYGGTIGECKTSSITFKYHLSTLVGEPVIFTNFKWENAYGTSLDCLSGEEFQIYIKVRVIYTSYWIPAAGTGGLVPKGDDNWGHNPLSGSPNWDELFLKNEPSKNSTEDFISADEAKAIWKSGSLRVVGSLILDKKGDRTNIN